MRSCWIHTLLHFGGGCEMCRTDMTVWSLLYGTTYMVRTEAGRFRVFDPSTIVVRGRP